MIACDFDNVLDGGSNEEAPAHAAQAHGTGIAPAAVLLVSLQQNARTDIAGKDKAGFDDGDHADADQVFEEALGDALLLRIQRFFEDVVGIPNHT